MRKAIICAVGLGCVWVAVMALAQAKGQSPPRAEPGFPVPAGARLPAAGGRPEGGDPRAVHAPQPGLPRHPAHVLGLRPGPVRPGRPGRPDGLPGRAGVQGREGGHAGPERDGQPDLSARDPGHDRRVHQPRPAAGPARAHPAELGRPGHQPADRVQLARRQVRAGDHRGADAGPAEGLQHLEGPGDARDRRFELGRDRGVHGRLGAAQRLPEGAEQRRQLREPAGRPRLPGEGAGEPRRSRSASSCATGGTTTAASAERRIRREAGLVLPERAADEGPHAEGVRRELLVGDEQSRAEVRRGDPAGDDAVALAGRSGIHRPEGRRWSGRSASRSRRKE